MVHAPIIAAEPGLELAGVWARRHDAAAALASAHGTVAHEQFEALLDGCDAVAFAVPPDVQAALAAKAARAGKALLLEKPIGLELTDALWLADIVAEAGVTSQVFLTWRYSADVRTFLAAAQSATLVGGRARFVSGAMLGGPFATPWRLEHGALLDLGPHVIDTLDAALGPVVAVRAHGDPLRWVGLLLEHESGVVSEASLSASVAIEPFDAGAQVFTSDAAIEVDAVTAITPATFATVAAEFVATARGMPHQLDVAHALHIQRIIDAAAADIVGSGSRPL
jgi:predicted dehydrogenase